MLRHARRGEEHPDPEIARAAKEWAEETLTPRQRSTGLLGVPLALFDSALGGGWMGMAFAEHRAAKRILRASPTKADTTPARRDVGGAGQQPHRR